jgi:hypothetical protein
MKPLVLSLGDRQQYGIPVAGSGSRAGGRLSVGNGDKASSQGEERKALE